MITDYIKPSLRKATLESEAEQHRVGHLLQMRAYEQATLYPPVQGKGGGVVTVAGDFLHGSSVYNEIEGQEGAYAASIEESSSEVVYLGAFYSCWGHCLTDCLRRLWFISSPVVDGRIKTLKFVYTRSSWGGEMPENFWALLTALGLPRERLAFVDRPTRFRTIWVPDPCFYKSGRTGRIEYTHEYADMIDRVITCVMQDRHAVPTRSVYFSRARWQLSGWQVNRERGMALVEAAFRQKGFEIVYPEKLSLAELVRLLQGCRAFASTDGSCAHNAIFLPKGATSIVVRKADYINQYQSAIHQLRGLNPVYIDANRSNMLEQKKYPMVGPFFLYVNHRLASFSGAKSYFPLGEYLIYVLHHYDRVMIQRFPRIVPLRKALGRMVRKMVA